VPPWRVAGQLYFFFFTYVAYNSQASAQVFIKLYADVLYLIRPINVTSSVGFMHVSLLKTRLTLQPTSIFTFIYSDFEHILMKRDLPYDSFNMSVISYVPLANYNLL
jgi:hypothetical protein